MTVSVRKTAEVLDESVAHKRREDRRHCELHTGEMLVDLLSAEDGGRLLQSSLLDHAVNEEREHADVRILEVVQSQHQHVLEAGISRVRRGDAGGKAACQGKELRKSPAVLRRSECGDEQRFELWALGEALEECVGVEVRESRRFAEDRLDALLAACLTPPEE